MEIKTNYEIKISDILKKFKNDECIEIIDYLLEYDEIEEHFNKQYLEKNRYEYEKKINKAIEEAKKEAKKEVKNYLLSVKILISPETLGILRKIKNNYYSWEIKIDIRYSFGYNYVADIEFDSKKAMLSFLKQIDYKQIGDNYHYYKELQKPINI